MSDNIDTMTFEEWWTALISLAKKEKLLWLLSNDPEDHRDSYENGNTPEEELNEQMYAVGS